ncbi:MAG: hypothetical protein EOP36_15915 [Rubrivivax sp.]|nr:MAG: hypothetical protein EOP36_15915 [Rubrivivax sp.]
MKSPLRCQCGTVRGQVDLAQAYGRAICYCKDCQAYARMLEQERAVLNRRGGTELIATLPASIRFTAGLDQLACVTLTEKGPLRWYASCCQTPIGNTPKDRRVPYVGVVRTCLGSSPAALDQGMGPVKMALNTKSARGKVASTPVATFVGMARIFKNIMGAQWAGRDNVNPFFVAGTGKPIQAPQAAPKTKPDALRRSA